jgi:hypothetical protein
MAESLLQLQAIADFVNLLLWTGQLPDERPVSAIIVAPAGAGKTTMLERMACEQAEFMGDLTARSLRACVQSDKVTHILLGDMLAMFGHRASTVKLTMQLVSQLTGEKLQHDPWTGEAIKPKQIGLITAIPPPDFLKQKAHIGAGGFASRFLVVKYTYKPSTIAAIHRFISRNGYTAKQVNGFGVIDGGKFEVKIPDNLADKIKDFGLTMKADPLGFRMHRHLRALVKAAARRCKRNYANESDLELIQSYCEFFSQEGKAI